LSNAGESSDGFSFIRRSIPRITTGSLVLDILLGGGLPICCIVDVFGAAGTGKTQFCFQNIVTTSDYLNKIDHEGTKAVFVDCSGSFRPERIVEIAESRSLDPAKILDNVATISARSSAEQFEISRKIAADPSFSTCRLLVVDDITSNFVSDYSRESEIPARQRALSLYARQLSYIANKKELTVLLTNSVRSRGDIEEGETTGEVLSEFALYRLHFSRIDRQRLATLVQPSLSKQQIIFEISQSGIA
jgi:DNA repair protein RadA